jgi:hypothetical protein
LFYTAPEDSWEDVDGDAAIQRFMDEACQVVLGDEYVLKSDRDIVSYDGYRYDAERMVHHGHYQHEDGQKMWNKIEVTLAQVESENQVVLVE